MTRRFARLQEQYQHRKEHGNYRRDALPYLACSAIAGSVREVRPRTCARRHELGPALVTGLEISIRLSPTSEASLLTSMSKQKKSIKSTERSSNAPSGLPVAFQEAPDGLGPIDNRPLSCKLFPTFLLKRAMSVPVAQRSRPNTRLCRPGPSVPAGHRSIPPLYSRDISYNSDCKTFNPKKKDISSG